MNTAAMLMLSSAFWFSNMNQGHRYERPLNNVITYESFIGYPRVILWPKQEENNTARLITRQGIAGTIYDAEKFCALMGKSKRKDPCKCAPKDTDCRWEIYKK